MAINCPGCGLSVDPIRLFEQSKKSKQWWRITKCPRERCGFNIEIDECDKPAPKPTKGDEKPSDGDNGRSFWRYGL